MEEWLPIHVDGKILSESIQLNLASQPQSLFPFRLRFSHCTQIRTYLLAYPAKLGIFLFKQKINFVLVYYQTGFGSDFLLQFS